MLLLQWNPKRSSDSTSLIRTSGHKREELATSNLGQMPEPSGRTDEKLGDLQVNHCVQTRSFVFMLRPQCVQWLPPAIEAVNCHNSASSSLNLRKKYFMLGPPTKALIPFPRQTMFLRGGSATSENT